MQMFKLRYNFNYDTAEKKALGILLKRYSGCLFVLFELEFNIVILKGDKVKTSPTTLHKDSYPSYFILFIDTWQYVLVGKIFFFVSKLTPGKPWFSLLRFCKCFLERIFFFCSEKTVVTQVVWFWVCDSFNIVWYGFN